MNAKKVILDRKYLEFRFFLRKWSMKRLKYKKEIVFEERGKGTLKLKSDS